MDFKFGNNKVNQIHSAIIFAESCYGLNCEPQNLYVDSNLH